MCEGNESVRSASVTVCVGFEYVLCAFLSTTLLTRVGLCVCEWVQPLTVRRKEQGIHHLQTIN